MRRLFRIDDSRICARMLIRFLCLSVLSVLLAAPQARAQNQPPKKPTASASAPKSIGKFDDWTAATHQESGQTVCYAFVRGQTTTPNRGVAVLTVTQRTAGRDAVAMAAPSAFPANASVTVQVDQAGLEFYTSGTNAFARDGKAVVAAFNKGSRAIARSPGMKNESVTDTFSLKGFSAAYAAIVKACPPK